MADIDRLLKMKKRIEDGEKEQANLQGRIDSLFEQLEKEFNVKTIEEAESLMKELEDKIEKMDEDLKRMTIELEKAYVWD